MTDLPQAPARRRDLRLDLFRAVAVVEGITTLSLFLVAMPVKYLLGDPRWVTLTGTVHGYAFVAYLVVMVWALWGRGWSAQDWWRTTFASFWPFGTFWNDAFLRRRAAQVGAAPAA